MDCIIKSGVKSYLDNLIERYPQLQPCKPSIVRVYMLLRECYSHGGKILTAGNGGSAADAEHIVGELMKSFKCARPLSPDMKERILQIDLERGSRIIDNLEQPLPAISLVTHEALTTAFLNDVGADSVFAQQVLGYGKPKDIFLGISTSGNSENVLEAAVTARALGLTVIGLTGENGGKLKKYCHECITVPETETFKIQELHLPVYHCLCSMIENEFFG